MPLEKGLFQWWERCLVRRGYPITLDVTSCRQVSSGKTIACQGHAGCLLCQLAGNPKGQIFLHGYLIRREATANRLGSCFLCRLSTERVSLSRASWLSRSRVVLWGSNSMLLIYSSSSKGGDQNTQFYAWVAVMPHTWEDTGIQPGIQPMSLQGED